MQGGISQEWMSFLFRQEELYMGISVRRLMTNTKKKYRITLLTGEGGLENTTQWVHIVEDYEAASFLHGYEIVLSTGIGNIKDKDNMLTFVRLLHEKNVSGVMFNLGPYIEKIPQKVIDFCNENDLPLYTIPWEVRLVDMTRYFCELLIKSDEKHKSIDGLVREYLLNEKKRGEVEEILVKYGVQSSYKYCVTILGFDENEGVEIEEKHVEKLHECIEREVSRRVEQYCLFQENNQFVLITIEIENAILYELLDIITHRFDNDIKIRIASGSNKGTVKQLPSNYQLAKKVYKLGGVLLRSPICYDELESCKLLLLLSGYKETELYIDEVIGRVIEYDYANGTDFVEFIENYIEYSGNIQRLATVMHVHRNTIHYKLKKIKGLIALDLTNVEDLFKIHLCLKLRRIQ